MGTLLSVLTAIWVFGSMVVFMFSAIIWMAERDISGKDHETTRKAAYYAITAWAWPNHALTPLREMWKTGMEWRSRDRHS